MEPSPMFPVSQSMTSTPSCVFPQFLQGSSSLELPSSQLSLQDATSVLGLNLPQNTLNILAQGQASGRLPALFNGPAGQPVRTAKVVAAAKQTTARSHSQPNKWKPSQPLIKDRARRAAPVARSRTKETTPVAFHQPAITTPSGDGKQGASQTTLGLATAVQAAAPQVEVPPAAHAGLHAAGMPAAASWGGRGESMSSMLDLKPFSWATATAVEISKRCGLDNLPIDLIERVLPRFGAFIKESERPAGTNSWKTGTAPHPAPSASNALTLHQNPCPSSVEGPELLPAAQLLASLSAPEQPAPAPPMDQTEWASTMEVLASAPTGMVSTTDVPEQWSTMDCFTWAPEPDSELSTAEGLTVEPPSELRQPTARTLTYEELEALLRQQDGAVLEPTMEEGPSAALEFLLDLEHSRAVEAGRSEPPLAFPTREGVERPLYTLPSHPNPSIELAQGAGTSGIGAGAEFDFGLLLDGWEGWAELGCPEKM